MYKNILLILLTREGNKFYDIENCTVDEYNTLLSLNNKNIDMTELKEWFENLIANRKWSFYINCQERYRLVQVFQ